jgi:hypothetical protein
MAGIKKNTFPRSNRTHTILLYMRLKEKNDDAILKGIDEPRREDRGAACTALIRPPPPNFRLPLSDVSGRISSLAENGAAIAGLDIGRRSW